MTVELCEAVRADLPALHYGDLEGPERAHVERHLEGCGPCRAALEAVRETAASLDRIPVVMPSQSDWVRLDARIEARVAPLRAQRFARSYGRFQLLSRVAAAALVGTLAVVSGGLYLQTRDQAQQIAALRGEIADVKQRTTALAFTATGSDLPVVKAYEQARQAGTAQEVRERIAALLAEFPKERLADQAYLALQKTGDPTPRQVGTALSTPFPLFPQQPVPETETLERTWRADIAAKRQAAASAQDPRVAAFILFRCAQQAEQPLGERALALELYREAAARLPGGAIAAAAEERIGALGK